MYKKRRKYVFQNFLLETEGTLDPNNQYISAVSTILKEEATEPKTFPCERPKCQGLFDSFSSLLRHVGKLKKCKNFYGPEKLEIMRKEAKNKRQKERRAAQSETERQLFLEKIRTKRSYNSEEIKAKQRLNYAKKKAKLTNTIYVDEISDTNSILFSDHLVE